jgi:hypothetical protein
VAIAGVARGPSAGFFTVEENGARILVEPVEDALPREGEPVLVFGTATSSGAGTAGYRSDPRRWTLDPRGEDGVVLIGNAGLDDRITRMRIQVVSGAVVFSIGLLIVGAAFFVSFAS